MSEHPGLHPLDEHNLRLASNVHPPEWQNPEPDGPYNLVVLGAGTAGLVTAAGAAGLGAKVALIERDLMGGDCLNVGCVPSKAIIAAARRSAGLKSLPDYGIATDAAATIDFAAVMERLRRLRADISPNDSAARFRDLGVDVFIGSGRFVSDHKIDVEGQVLEFKKAVIATGARASAPPIPGLEEAGYLTNETLFSLTQRPERLAVIGGGPIGCEMAQAFAQLGTDVLQIERGDRLLPRDDADASQIVQQALTTDGVKIYRNTKTTHVSSVGGKKILTLSSPQGEDEVEVDEILVSIGRSPNVTEIGLEAAGVRFDANQGVEVNDRLQTSVPHIFAAGDVCSKYKFTHAADFSARIVIQNALFLGRSRASKLLVPWCTYTTPEVAHVGVLPAEADQQGLAIDTFTQEFDEVDRAILDGETTGYVRIHVRAGTDRIVGATIVGQHAGDLISEVTLAMKNGIGLRKIGSTIHPYPTRAEAIRRLGDAYNRTRLKPWVQKLFAWWLRRGR